MRSSPRPLPFAVRGLALALPALASLRLALLVAQAVFLHRQGQGRVADGPAMGFWMLVVVAGAALYPRAGRIADRLMAGLGRRGAA